MSIKLKKIKPLSTIQEKNYKERKKVVGATGRLERKITKLKERRDELDAKLEPIFEKTNNFRKLSDGTIVERKLIEIDERIATKVGQIIQTGFSYPKYVEMGE